MLESPYGLRAIYATVFLMNDILVDQIKLLPLPEDMEKNNRTWLAPLKLTDNAKSLPAFIELVDEFIEASKGDRKEPHLTTLRRHWDLVLLNLSCAVFQRRWQLYAKDGRTQKKLDVYSANDWKARTLAHVVDHLIEHGLIFERKGAL